MPNTTRKKKKKFPLILTDKDCPTPFTKELPPSTTKKREHWCTSHCDC